jgi:hypothetical protein
MTHILSLGAINKLTGEYVYPKIANKKDEYICPECNKDLILGQGEIRVHHFRHKVDSINPCQHYSNPTETQIHKDAKILLKNLLERKIPISFIRNCCCCKENEEYEIPEITETSVIQLEYRFDYNGIKIADVAYIDDNEILCIFEIYNTHKTCSENRPEPWFEINAETLIKIANDNTLTTLQIPCIRCEKCDECVEKEKYYFMIKREKEKYKHSIIKFNKLTGLTICSNYEKKYYAGYGYTGDLLEFVIKCDKFMNDLVSKYESKIYIKDELDKNIFDECYYSKYHRAIKYNYLYGENGKYVHEEDGNQLWGGWSGNRYINNGCYKPTMYKFIKYYKLINPMNIKKYLIDNFA